MTQKAQSLQGRCLCGVVAYDVQNAFDQMYLCSCDQCRQITGSAFAANLFVPAKLFRWLSGEADITRYKMPGRDISKSFCRICGSGVPWPNGDTTKMVVPAGTLQGEPQVAKTSRVFAAEQPSWAQGLEQIKAHKGFPT